MVKGKYSSEIRPLAESFIKYGGATGELVRHYHDLRRESLFEREKVVQLANLALGMLSHCEQLTF